MTRSAPVIRVLLWFDTEDYLLRADDDAILRIATFLTQRGIRGIFKMVGEKARVLARRGRRDVIAAIKRHEIGFHTDLHSVHPTPAAYCAPLGWDEGVAEFIRREGRGVADITRIFGTRPVCYGQPGGSWSPQSFGAMAHWRMPVFMSAGGPVRVGTDPHYYLGALSFSGMANFLRVGLDRPEDLPPVQDRFLAIHQRLIAQGGGLAGLMYHPNEFVQRKYWDEVNFRHGANPPRKDWVPPPAKSPAQVRQGFENFENYIRFLQSLPGVRFITTADAVRHYRDRALHHLFTRRELLKVAEGVRAGVTFQRDTTRALSAGEVFSMLSEVVARGRTAVRLNGSPIGPTGAGPAMVRAVRTTADQFVRTAVDVAASLAAHGRIPSSVWLGSVAVPPEAYLVALAKAARLMLAGRRLPRQVTVPTARLAAADHVANDGPELWGWDTFPRGFCAPAMMQLAKRQSWTLKPAIAQHQLH